MLDWIIKFELKFNPRIECGAFGVKCGHVDIMYAFSIGLKQNCRQTQWEIRCVFFSSLARLLLLSRPGVDIYNLYSNYFKDYIGFVFLNSFNMAE